MTCDDVLPALELGDAPRQRAAHAHAQGCPECAKVIEGWAALKSALVSTPALTDRDRATWREARREPRPRRVPRAWLFGGATAACVSLALLWPRPVPEPPLPEPPPEVRAEPPASVAPEFADLDRKLDQLDDELAGLERRVALADVRREAAELVAEYRQ